MRSDGYCLGLYALGHWAFLDLLLQVGIRSRHRFIQVEIGPAWVIRSIINCRKDIRSSNQAPCKSYIYPSSAITIIRNKIWLSNRWLDVINRIYKEVVKSLWRDWIPTPAHFYDQPPFDQRPSCLYCVSSSFNTNCTRHKFSTSNYILYSRFILNSNLYQFFDQTGWIQHNRRFHIL